MDSALGCQLCDRYQRLGRGPKLHGASQAETARLFHQTLWDPRKKGRASLVSPQLRRADVAFFVPCVSIWLLLEMTFGLTQHHGFYVLTPVGFYYVLKNMTHKGKVK